MINYDKFLYFTKLQLETGDYDAHIPFFKRLLGDQIGTEKACELGFLYMAYYNEASAWCVHNGGKCEYPIEQQRRNLYGGRIYPHLEDLAARVPWLERLRKLDNWSSLLECIGAVYGNGRWASYTTAELLMHLAQLTVRPDSFEILESSGPRGGLEDLGLDVSEASARLVHDALISDGCVLNYSQLESILCDWHGMCKGTFYAGRNIDRQQGRILKVAGLLEIEEVFVDSRLAPLWLARRCFDCETRGEVVGGDGAHGSFSRDGWSGIDKQRLKVYKETGVVLAPWEER